MDDDKLVSTAEAAKILGIGRKAVNTAINEGKINAVWIGNRYVILVSDVKKYHPAGKPIRAEWFWERVDKPEEGCWEWQRKRSKQGYGQLQKNRVSLYAHRVAWELENGSIPKGKLVLHKCDNPPCCRPDHLFIGTQKDNIQDAIKKGRMWIVKEEE